MPFMITTSPERNHPCFYSESKGRFGRIHLPVAPKCNIQCAYCRRDNDCPHENRPGVTSGVISPEEALDRLENALEKMPFISVAGIAGPGEAFCEPELTLETFERIRRKGLNIALCVSSNGLNVTDHIQSLLELKVHFVTVTINTIDPGIGTILYKKVRTGRGTIKGGEASELLIAKQMEAVSALKAARFVVKVNSVIVPGVNDRHIPFVAKRMQDLGVDLMNLIPLIPLPGTAMAEFDPPRPAEMKKLRKLAGQFVPQMHHCRRCRSDAAGLLDTRRLQGGVKMKEIDARGLACPAPVLQTKAALQEQSPSGVRVVVDNAASQQNVQRFLESQGFKTALEQVGSDYVVVGSCDSIPWAQIQPAPASSGDTRKIMVMCATDRIGFGDDSLGLKLMVNLLRTLKEMGVELWRLVFVNNCVKLTIEGSEVLEDLQAYESASLKILVCGTCLDHFKLLEKKRVGETTNMLDIVSAMQLADRVINI